MFIAEPSQTNIIPASWQSTSSNGRVDSFSSLLLVARKKQLDLIVLLQKCIGKEIISPLQVKGLAPF
jgi:hypothetical protein